MSLVPEGFILGMSLIAAIGPQNALVLSNGVRKKFILLTPFTTSLCDTILILVGVFGCGQVLNDYKASKISLMILGAVFLSIYSLKCIISLFKQQTLEAKQNTAATSIKKTILYAVGLSFLNPHAILDTIIIIGSVSSVYEGAEAIEFAAGLVTSSFFWFFSISLFASRFSKYLSRPKVWKIIELIVSIVCLRIVYNLVNDILLLIQ